MNEDKTVESAVALSSIKEVKRCDGPRCQVFGR